MHIIIDFIRSLFTTTVHTTPELVLQLMISGLAQGSIYAVVAIGFTIVFSTTQVVNFAQGEFVMLGAMITYWFAAAEMGPHWTNSAAVPAAVLIATVIGALLGWVLMRVRRGANPTTLIIITIGASILLQGIASRLWKTEAVYVPHFTQTVMDGSAYPKTIEIPLSDPTMPAVIFAQNLWVIGFLLVIAVALIIFFQFTMIGKAMRAVSANPTGARLLGINVSRLVVGAFALSGAIGALGGAFLAPITASYDMGPALGLKGFAAAIVGGLGSFPGSIIAGLVLGIAEQFFGMYKSTQYQGAFVFMVLLIVLFISPHGILALFRRGRARA
jgi:branched-chain amino acid transport system permease protein